jgi:hypothetical protein
VKLLGKDSMVGCIGNLYTSVEKLDDPYIQPGAVKDAMLSPTVLSPAAKSNRSFFRLPEPSPSLKKFFRCGSYSYYSCPNYVTEERGAQCPMCGTQMFGDSQYVSSEHLTQEAKGLVQGGMVTYTVTDDLKIFPMSNISSIALLNTIAVKDLGALQERIVQLGYKEVRPCIIYHCVPIHMHFLQFSLWNCQLFRNRVWRFSRPRSSPKPS